MIHNFACTVLHVTLLNCSSGLLHQLLWLPVEFGIKLKLTVFSISRALSSAAAHQAIFQLCQAILHLHLHVSNFFTFLHFYMLCIDTVHIYCIGKNMFNLSKWIKYSIDRLIKTLHCCTQMHPRNSAQIGHLWQKNCGQGCSSSRTRILGNLRSKSRAPMTRFFSIYCCIWFTLECYVYFYPSQKINVGVLFIFTAWSSDVWTRQAEHEQSGTYGTTAATPGPKQFGQRLLLLCDPVSGHLFWSFHCNDCSGHMP